VRHEARRARVPIDRAGSPMIGKENGKFVADVTDRLAD
jgi:hypothetical protein